MNKDTYQALLIGCVLVALIVGATILKSGVDISTFIASFLCYAIITASFFGLLYAGYDIVHWWSVGLCAGFACLTPMLSEMGSREIGEGSNLIMALLSSEKVSFEYYDELRWYAKWYWQLAIAVFLLLLEPLRLLAVTYLDERESIRHME